MKTISSIGEFGLIQKIASHLKFNKDVRIGPGDDCAVVRFARTGKAGSSLKSRGRYRSPPLTIPHLALLTTDMLIEGIHFCRDWMTPKEIGFKAMRVNLSDIAAMGGRPLYALISVGLPRSLPVTFATGLFEGLQKAGKEAGCAIVGGDTNASDRLILNVAIMGEALSGKFITRGGARAGDRLYVTGTLGASALGLAVLRKKKRKKFEADVRRHLTPPLRVSVGQFLARLPGIHAMIDLSDGLAGDLPHILEQSRVGAVLDLDRIPRPPGFEKRARVLDEDPLSLALSGGEDYELLFAASPRVKIPSKIHGVPVTKIGRITPKQEGLRRTRRLRGFRHF